MTVPDDEPQREYRTLRGWLAGEEPDEPPYFAHSATLRIFGEISDLDEITRALGLTPTDTHRRGDKKGPRSPGYPHDMWRYCAPVHEEEPLGAHIDALWERVRPHTSYLLDLKKRLTVDVFLGYRSNCDHAGIEVPHTSLEMFVSLQVPFGVSVIIA